MKLHLGCGRKKKEGYLGIDILDLPSVDIVWDLEKGLPFVSSDSVHEVVMEHLIEHLRPNFLSLMKEIHRICINGAKVFIITPHASYPQFWRDPTHVRPYTEETFRYFWDWNIYGLPVFKTIECDVSDLEQMRVVLEVVKPVRGL